MFFSHTRKHSERAWVWAVDKGKGSWWIKYQLRTCHVLILNQECWKCKVTTISYARCRTCDENNQNVCVLATASQLRLRRTTHDTIEKNERRMKTTTITTRSEKNPRKLYLPKRLHFIDESMEWKSPIDSMNLHSTLYLLHHKPSSNFIREHEEKQTETKNWKTRANRKRRTVQFDRLSSIKVSRDAHSVDKNFRLLKSPSSSPHECIMHSKVMRGDKALHWCNSSSTSRMAWGNHSVLSVHHTLSWANWFCKSPASMIPTPINRNDVLTHLKMAQTNLFAYIHFVACALLCNSYRFRHNNLCT